MATFIGQFRTNYFKVKSLDAFKTWLELWCVEDQLHLFGPREDGSVGVGAYDSLPSHRKPRGREKPDPDSEDREADFAQELKQHLAAGEVAILTEAGSEKLRYVGGSAACIPARGRVTYYNPIEEAMKRAKRLAKGPVTHPYS